MAGQKITVADAQVMTEKFRTSFPANYASATFDKSFVEDILNNQDGKKLRVYFGIDDTELITAILIATDGNNEDLTNGDIVEFGDHGNANPL